MAKKTFGQWKYIQNVWDFRKLFQRNLHPFRDIFHKRLLSTFLSGISLSLDSCNKKCTKPLSSWDNEHFLKSRFLHAYCRSPQVRNKKEKSGGDGYLKLCLHVGKGRKFCGPFLLFWNQYKRDNEDIHLGILPNLEQQLLVLKAMIQPVLCCTPERLRVLQRNRRV